MLEAEGAVVELLESVAGSEDVDADGDVDDHAGGDAEPDQHVVGVDAVSVPVICDPAPEPSVAVDVGLARAFQREDGEGDDAWSTVADEAV